MIRSLLLALQNNHFLRGQETNRPSAYNQQSVFFPAQPVEEATKFY